MKVIYTGLALLLGIGLIGFGVGSVGGGSLFESVGREGRGGNRYAAKTAAARKRIKQNPNDAAAWGALMEALLHESTGGENYNSVTERYTAQGKEKLRRVANAWNHYLQLEPNHPSAKLARDVVNIFAVGALNEPSNAVQALQVQIASEPPKAAVYSALADYAYLAHNNRQGDLASKKALALLPKSKRPLAEIEFERFKKSANTPTGSGAAGAAGTAATTTSTSASASKAASGKKKK